ncbi:MAG: pyridoxine 5'-phosphate synthase, partial [bacterium]|nr:pyridoxine 5'-phosphate synthase [bacterium]
MATTLSLCVNVDHIATLRQARGTRYPDPVDAAALAERAGAAGITVHLRHDRRHIQDSDVERLRQTIAGKLNLEMATSDEMLAIACNVRPDQVSLVPERPEEITTEGGLDVVSGAREIRRAAEVLKEAGVTVSVFMDPDLAQLEALAALSGLISGFEINTDAYTLATGDAVEEELRKAAEVATAGAEAGFRVYAGHGLTTANVGGIAALPEVEELNIGHWLVSRASLVGIDEAVTEMLAAMAAAR